MLAIIIILNSCNWQNVSQKPIVGGVWDLLRFISALITVYLFNLSDYI